MAIKGLENSPILLACAAIEMPDCRLLNEHEDFPRTIITRKADTMARFVVTSAGIGKLDAHTEAAGNAQLRFKVAAMPSMANCGPPSFMLLSI